MKTVSAEYDVLAKSIIIGDSSVGKSSLLYRYIDQDWNPHYIATIGVDFKVLTFERQQKVVKLQLWDTAGQERFRTITHTYYRGCHGVLVVFDVTNRESFLNISTWLADVKRFATAGVPLVLVGNKYDAPADEHQVSDDEARALANELGCAFHKVSARANTGVDEAFGDLVEKCVAQRMSMLAKISDTATKKAPVRFGGVDGDGRPLTKKDGICAC